MLKSHGFENGVFQAERLAMIADPMGTLYELLKCDFFLRAVFQLKVGKGYNRSPISLNSDAVTFTVHYYRNI